MLFVLKNKAGHSFWREAFTDSIVYILCKLVQMYGFIRKIEPFHLRMKHNIIQMTATAGLIVPHSINPIFQYIFDCLGFIPVNGNFDFMFQGLNRLWMVSVKLIGYLNSKTKESSRNWFSLFFLS